MRKRESAMPDDARILPKSGSIRGECLVDNSLTRRFSPIDNANKSRKNRRKMGHNRLPTPAATAYTQGYVGIHGVDIRTAKTAKGGTPMLTENTVVRTVTVSVENGLHMRPASEVARLCSEYDGAVRVRKNGASTMDAVADARNILEVLCLAAGHGEILVFEVEGGEADALLDRLCEVLEQST